MRLKTLTIVGVGLIGGSIGLAAKQRGVAARVIGVGRQPESLNRAATLGAIDEAQLDLVTAVGQAELAVFCTPVDLIAGQVLAAAPACSPGTLLTDAGSTKAVILASVESRIPPGVCFVGSHPLAGSEKRGPEHASPDLFQNRLTIVTRSVQTDPKGLERTSAFWHALGSRVKIMDPVEHDKVLALTSHLPHLVAAALASALPSELGSFTASGFRDTTRIASGDPSLWTAIFMQNRDLILEALAGLGSRLDEFRQVLVTEDWTTLNELLTRAKRVRDALGS
jgi:cyclohexadieny/prephenate dehydrogenase